MNNAVAKITSAGHRDVPLLDLPVDETQNDADITPIATVQIEQPSLPNGHPSHDAEKHLRAKLRYFFMSPCWKWHLKRQFPWKAWFQFIKIILVTAQLILFGIERQTHVIFISESNTTFHHLFIRGWSASDETLPYPRASGDFAVYTNKEFLDSINFAVHRFNNLANLSLGLFDFHDHSSSKSVDINSEKGDRVVKLCLNRFKTCRIDPTSHTYILDSEIEDACFTFNATDSFDVEHYLLHRHNETISYCGLNELTLKFAIHAIQLKNQKPFSLPDCYHFSIKITFDNNVRTGKIRVHLNSQAKFRTCNRQIINQNSSSTFVRRDLLIAFDGFVVFICVISFTLCFRSLWHGHKLCKEVRLFYKTKRPEEKSLTWHELQIFYSFWYILMIITDIFVISGTIIKIGILCKVMDDYNAAGLLLGLSSLLSWVSFLRYLSFFRKYNLLFVTIKKALPLLLRFLFCSFIIYCGFMFCGWIVLGPYHTKFRTLSTTFETLFGLINGDDMYTTFANLETESIHIWIFSEIYLYSFSCLFIYVISSLVIALIIDGYETVKEYYTGGFPKTRLQIFSEEDIRQLSSAHDWQDLTTAVESKSACFPCCFRTPSDLTDVAARDVYLVRHINSFA
ncbi:unnamed protein product [Adineta steineri]|uniref:Uncharacterized protein n=2 Tax=Adineta steineri TaxID=433720 RepID=A0A815QU41_9BILA|nr:unnamed protein product [Adineta steineri]CAF4179569.1 unnamed protein product [Adineta steineri]